MKDKLVYVVPLELDASKANGVLKKILMQLDVFNTYCESYVIGYYGSGIGVLNDGEVRPVPTKKTLNRRFALYESAALFVKSENVRNVYIRYGYCDFAFLKMLRQMKKISGTRIVLEIPTFPYDKEMAKKSAKYRLLRVIDNLTRHQLKNYIDLIATFSTDRKIFEIPCVHIVNGVSFQDIKKKSPTISNSKISMIAVSSMGFNHGYERIIEGMNIYYCSGGTRDIEFLLVGDGVELPKYKKLIERYALSDRVTCYGFQTGANLEQLYDASDIAVASLGMHRADIYLASTLKTREYAAKGLPIVTSCKIDVFPDDWEYLLNVSADEAPVDINEIVRFYDRVYRNSTDEDTVAEQIRAYAQKRCDIFSTMMPVIDFFFHDFRVENEGGE